MNVINLHLCIYFFVRFAMNFDMRNKNIRIKIQATGMNLSRATNFDSRGSSTLETVIIMSVLIVIMLALILMLQNMMFVSYYVTSCNYKSYNVARENNENRVISSAKQDIDAEVIAKSFIFDFFMKRLYFEYYPRFSIASNSTHFNNYRVLRVANSAEYIVKRLIYLTEINKKESESFEK